MQHLTYVVAPFPGLPRFLFFGLRKQKSTASMYHTERKPKNKKRGRPGNEATYVAYMTLTHNYTGRDRASQAYWSTHMCTSLTPRPMMNRAQFDGC